MKASPSPTQSSSALVPSKFAEHWHAASRISHADELQLACRLAECRRERLTLALNTPACLGRLRRIQTEMASRKVRIQDVVELVQPSPPHNSEPHNPEQQNPELRGPEQGLQAFADWLARAEQLQRKASEAWQNEALSVAHLQASEELVRELTLRPAALARALGEGPGAEAYARRSLAALPPHLQQRSRRLESEVERIHDRFLTANQGLVAYVVQRYLGMGLSQEDLMQEGNIGLMRAVDKFDHRRGGRFGTYAVWWVRQGVRRALANQSRTIRIPVHALGARYSLEQAARRMTMQLGRDPTEEELSRATGVVPSNVTQLLSLAREPLSLDAPRGTDTDVRLVDGLADSGTPDGMQHALGKQRAEQLRGLLGSLSDRERSMLRMRFGLDGADECTLEQIGVSFCVTRERVRQIVTGALQKLHRQTRMQRLELASTAD